jgi:hypothetical protein
MANFGKQYPLAKVSSTPRIFRRVCRGFQNSGAYTAVPTVILNSKDSSGLCLSNT